MSEWFSVFLTNWKSELFKLLLHKDSNLFSSKWISWWFNKSVKDSDDSVIMSLVITYWFNAKATKSTL